MGRRTLLTGMVTGVVGLSLLGGSAMAAATAPNPRDVTAARAIISAYTRFDRAAWQHRGAETAAVKAVVVQVQEGCAGSLPASLANGTKQQQKVVFDLVSEGSFNVGLAALHSLDHASLVLAHSLDRVHFTKRGLTRRIHVTAKAERAVVALHPGDLCADIKATAAGGFAADPPGTTHFLAQLDRPDLNATLGVPDILKDTKPFLVTSRDRAAARRLKDLEVRYEDFATTLGAKWGAKLAEVLSGPQPPAGGSGGFPTNPPPPSGSHMKALLSSS